MEGPYILVICRLKGGCTSTAPRGCSFAYACLPYIPRRFGRSFVMSGTRMRFFIAMSSGTRKEMSLRSLICLRTSCFAASARRTAASCSWRRVLSRSNESPLSSASSYRRTTLLTVQAASTTNSASIWRTLRWLAVRRSDSALVWLRKKFFSATFSSSGGRPVNVPA